MLFLFVNCRKSLLMQLFMGHIVSSLHLLKERIFFFMCILNLVFKFGLCLFTFPLLNFSQNLFCFSYFYRGRSLVLTFVVHRESCLSFLKNWIVLCFLNSLLSLDFCQYVTKRGGFRWNVVYDSCLFCLWGVEIVFEMGRI